MIFYSVELSEDALEDLKEIYLYIAFHLLAPQTAEQQYQRLEKGIQRLNQMPERYSRCRDEPWFSREVRIMRIDNYNVFFHVNHKKATVNVIRIAYNKRLTEHVLSNYELHEEP